MSCSQEMNQQYSTLAFLLSCHVLFSSPFFFTIWKVQIPVHCSPCHCYFYCWPDVYRDATCLFWYTSFNKCWDLQCPIQIPLLLTGKWSSLLQQWGHDRLPASHLLTGTLCPLNDHASGTATRLQKSRFWASGQELYPCTVISCFVHLQTPFTPGVTMQSVSE